MKACAAVAVAIAAAVMIAACGSSSQSSASSQSASGSQSSAASSSGSTTAATTKLQTLEQNFASYTKPITTYPDVTPIPDGIASLKGKTIWWVPLGASIPILAAVGNSMEDALRRAGLKVETCDGKLLPTAIAACLNEAQAQGASGVVTGFVDYASEPAAFKSLVSHNIPVLVAGESPDGGATSSTAKLGFYPAQSTDNLMQKLEMESAITSSAGKGNILYIGVTDSPSTDQETAYAKAFAKSQCGGCTFTDITYNTAAIGKLPSAVSAALISNPNTTYVVCAADACVPSAVQGIESAGYRNKVKLISSNGDLSSLQLIKSGSLLSDAGVDAAYNGWQYADGILRMLTGHPPVATVTAERVFDSSNVSPLKLTPAAYATNAWYGSDAFEQKFLTAWSGK